MSHGDFTDAEAADAERAVAALLRARHDGRVGDELTIVTTMTERELRATVLTMAGIAYDAFVRMVALRVLVTDDDAAGHAMDTPVSEMGQAGLDHVAELLATIHGKIAGL
jgi:hypothetical protein